jgi:hypothetical protein
VSGEALFKKRTNGILAAQHCKRAGQSPPHASSVMNSQLIELQSARNPGRANI